MANRLTTTQAIFRAALIAGTLDILAAIFLTLWFGRPVDGMLRYVASGPFPEATLWGAGGALLGLATHYVLMTIMAAAFVLAASRFAALKTSPVVWGALYGLATFAVMNLIVVPLRFGTYPGARAVLTQLFCHIVLVGIPIAFVARRT